MVPLLDVFDYKLVKTLYAYSNKLQKATKKADKTKLLQQAKDDKDLKYFLDFVLNPRIITGLSDKKINQLVRLDVEWDTDFYGICNYLKKHNSGRNEDIAVVKHYLNQFDGGIKEFLIRVFTKNLPLGVEVKTVNKALGFTLIPDWQVQQGYPIDKVKLKEGTWFSLSRKENGNRGTFYKGEFISRQAQVFQGLEHIKNDLLVLCDNNASKLDSLVFDGELIYKNPENLSDGEAFRYGTGVLNSNDKDKSCIKFVIFDVIPVEEFDGKCSTKYKIRREWLNKICLHILEMQLKNIEVVPMVYEGTDQSVIPQWLDYAVANDWEGLMLNTSVPYKRARHTGCLKIKRFYTLDLRIVAIEEGQNRLSGTMGALVVDYNGNELRVGSGFDDDVRKNVWTNRDSYVGKIVEVKYKEKTSNKDTGAESLQFPTFVRFRDDKDEVSYG